MAKNKVQFQKSMTIHAFMNKFGSEAQCRSQLFRIRWPNGFICPNCGHTHYSELHSRPLYQCNQCRHQASITAGTIFAYSKLPLTTWFLAIYLITQDKNGISALELSRQLGVSYNATWRLKQKLMQAMKERDDEHPLTGFIQLDDAYWGGARSGKPGRGAAGKRPFVAAVSISEEGHPLKMRFSVVSGFTKEELSNWALSQLLPSSLVVSDGLACFSGVEAAHVVHLPIVTGGGPQSVKLPYFKWVNTMISNVKRSLHGTYHAISLKHLPRYLSEFNFRFNHRFHMESMIAALIRDGVHTAPMPSRLLKLAEPQW